MADHVNDNAVAQFVAITGAPSRQAQHFLAASNGDIETAVSNYYAAQEDHTEDKADDRNDESSDDEKQDLFAGGEKSGLAVQNPQDDIKKRILEKAQRRGPPPKESPQKKSFFTGAARTLGGDDTPSQEIPAAAAAQPQQAARVERTLHFWRDGFSVDDGDLYRNDDARNAQLLQLIQQGRAPLAIMNVQPGQEVDVELKQHDENYVRPKKKYKPFAGHGNRLGSPTPGFQSSTHPMPGAFDTAPASVAPASAPAASANTTPAGVEVDESQPTLTLRVSLGSGTRVTSRFNASHTVGDVYDFVRRQEPGGREFVLQTIFPTAELKDRSQVLGDMAEFKRGGAVVQKYV
ncbi:hypothetical protein DV737_g3686, partial [Chaetothyriales sp. CBS 132003]